MVSLIHGSGFAELYKECLNMAKYKALAFVHGTSDQELNIFEYMGRLFYRVFKFRKKHPLLFSSIYPRKMIKFAPQISKCS